MARLFTIGYATKPIETFLAQLSQYGIDVVADVRSVPYSRVFTDYHRENLQAHLRERGIRYVYLGAELGPRSTDSAHYDERGQVQYDRLMASIPFRQGIERLQNGVRKGFTVTLMCAEKDPAVCHRSLLVACHLESAMQCGDSPIDSITHITHDGKVESQGDLRERLVALHGLESDLLRSPDEQLSEAYRLQIARYSYSRDPVAE
ncbi:MAG: DUF488 domain-containing protein [Pseudomonadota bacterium]